MKRFTLAPTMRARATAVVAALVLSAALAGRSAAADPIASKRAEAARIAAQLKAKAEQAEILTEKYNAARIKAGAAEADAAKAARELAAAEVAVKASEQALKESARQAYVHGGLLPLSNAGVTPNDALELSIRRKYVNVVADRQADAVHAMRVARIDASDRRAKLDDAKQASRQALTAVEAKRQAAAAAVQSQKALLAKVNGELATLIAAEQRRKAEEEARRVRAALVSANKAPTGGKLNTDTGKAPVDPPPAPNAGAATAVAEAKKQLGKPYEWAAAGPDSFDCSGLTQWAWKAAGKLLSHYTAAQYNETARVEIKDLQPGDLVFFGSDLHHVGLYVGNGQMIHAPQTGDVVRYDTIYRSDLMQLGGRVR